MMSLSRLSAGSGYRYLLRHTACGDACRENGNTLTAYYASSGLPAGWWLGRGLAGVDAGRGLAQGSLVTEDAMAALYGKGHDPVSGEALGKPYATYRSAEDRVAEALAGLPDTLADDEVAERRAEIERAERARPMRAAVAGFDLTFTVPKSASVLWALGDQDIQLAVMEAHRDAVTAVLELVEDRSLRTRIGPGGCAQVASQGMVAAAFDHWDTRTGDPNLHTHVVIANKVQGPDGAWRSLDSRAMHHAAVALSEVYDDLIADALATRLPLSWSWRDRGERRSPAFEIDGLDDTLLAAFSTRSGQIAATLRELLTQFRDRYGRDPDRREILRLRQQATLATRPEKTVLPLGELLARWRSTATTLTGQTPETIVEAALRATGSDTAREIDVATLAGAVITGIAERRSTWTRANLLAEAARATRHLRTPTATARIALLDTVTDAALSHCVPLDPPELFETPHRFRSSAGTSVFTRPEEHAFTTVSVLDAEARLLAATSETGAPAVPDRVLAPVLAAAATGMPGARGLHRDQVAAVAAVAGSGRRLDVLVGPAGSGKTRALRALRAAWENAHGPGSVLGLAPSATAAVELAASLAIGCENTTKWLHEAGRATPGGGIDPRWSMQPGQLVIIDEASMVTTDHLDKLVAQAQSAGAKVLLVGDHHQLSAVGAGGAFGLLSDTPNVQSLHGLWRFRHRWEAQATRALRDGHAQALDAYAEHGRLHDGPTELMLEDAYTAWAADIAAGHTALLLAADRATVNALNTRAHDDRVSAGLVHDDGIALADDTTAGRGDLIVTRRNDRRLPVHQPDGRPSHVRNGALWQIEHVHPDGSIEAVATDGARASLAAAYVRDHVELGYATTVHRAQGLTVEHAHVIATGATTRQSFYVAVTRGRETNHVYIPTDADSTSGSGAACPNPTEPTAQSGLDVLRRVLATDGAELSATATLRRRQIDATSLRRLLPIRDLLASAEHDPQAAAARDQIDAIIRARAAHARNPHPSTAGNRPRASAHHCEEGIHR